MITRALRVPSTEFFRATGWEVKPEGACRGDLCVPLPADALAPDGTVDVALTAERLGMPLVRDEARDLIAVGPATLGGRALASADAPELVLPTIDGAEFRLSSLRGQKVCLVAWAPY